MLRKYVFISFAALSVVGTAIARPRGASMNKPEQSSLRGALERVNNYSKTAKGRNDDRSTKILTDAIIDTFVPPTAASDVLKERLFALEKEHRQSGNVRITEASLTRAINS